MTRDLFIVGCGGFGREVVGIVDAINARRATWNLLGFLDDAPSAQNLERAHAVEVPVLGSAGIVDRDSDAAIVIAIAEPTLRKRLAETMGAEQRAATLVDPAARLGRGVSLGSGVVIAAGVHLTTNVVVGGQVHLDRGVQVGHDSTLGDFTTLHPGVVVSGGCTVEQGARLGTHATLLPGVRIGSGAVVGAGSCVVRDVADYTVVRGVPAR